MADRGHFPADVRLNLARGQDRSRGAPAVQQHRLRVDPAGGRAHAPMKVGQRWQYIREQYEMNKLDSKVCLPIMNHVQSLARSLGHPSRPGPPSGRRVHHNCCQFTARQEGVLFNDQF